MKIWFMVKEIVKINRYRDGLNVKVIKEEF